MITQKPKGTQDWYGSNMNQRTRIEALARELCQAYHIQEISTPVFEHTVLFQRGVGETTDVVQKEMYTFEDKGGRSITLSRRERQERFGRIWKITCMQRASRQSCFI